MDRPDLEALEASGGLELFPCFTTCSAASTSWKSGAPFIPNLPQDGTSSEPPHPAGDGGASSFLPAATSQTYVLSPLPLRFLSMLFGRLVISTWCCPWTRTGLSPFTPYSLEEQVVAGYLQSLTRAPCATIKLDAQDNPYIGSMLTTPNGTSAAAACSEGAGGGHHPGLAAVQTSAVLFHRGRAASSPGLPSFH